MVASRDRRRVAMCFFAHSGYLMGEIVLWLVGGFGALFSSVAAFVLARAKSPKARALALVFVELLLLSILLLWRADKVAKFLNLV